MKKTIGRPQPFGAVVERDRVNFAVQVPAGKTCELLVYRRGEETPRFCFDMPEEEGIGEVRFLALEEIDAAEYEYPCGRKSVCRSLCKGTGRQGKVRSAKRCPTAPDPGADGVGGVRLGG